MLFFLVIPLNILLFNLCLFPCHMCLFVSIAIDFHQFLSTPVLAPGCRIPDVGSRMQDHGPWDAKLWPDSGSSI